MNSVLLIGPDFFGYRESIAKEMRKHGILVNCISDRPSESIAYKSIDKVFPQLLSTFVNSWTKKLSENIKCNKYKLVLYIGGSSFPYTADQFIELRKASPNSKFAVYLWDSIQNCTQLSGCLDYFDKVISFERDATLTSTHLPLFYEELFDTCADSPLDSAQYDACFVGSVHHISKFKYIVNVLDSLRAAGMSVSATLFMPSRLSLLLRMLQDPVYRRKDLEFTFTPLSRSAIADLYSKSACIIDSPAQGQTGLTMRTIEALGARRKIITANSLVREYDFYRYGDVLASPFDTKELIKFCINRKYSTPDTIRKKYALSSWVNELLIETGLK